MDHFDEIDLIAALRRSLGDLGYETPTPIQAQTIPAALDGRDVLGCAQTGTGKTAAFALPLLQRLGERNRKAQPHRPLALVLAPTRELAIQIGDACRDYGKHLKLRQAMVFGGVSQNSQVRELRRGVHLLVATPGRLLDLMEQGFIELDRLETFVLDEADRMLDMGFLPDLKRIIRELPEQRQSLFFSATMSPAIRELTGRLLRDPVTVNVTPKKASVRGIDQQVAFVGRGDKLEALHDVLACPEARRVIVFTRTKRGANGLAEKLEKRGFRATAIHGNKSQAARTRALDAFRRDRVRVLVATDVAARGIDVDDVTHVINFDIPTEPESYVHRIGRTGRAGATGSAISFCSQTEHADWRAIEKLIGHAVPLAAAELQRESPPGAARDIGGRRAATAGGGQPQRRRFKSSRAKVRGATYSQKPGRDAGDSSVTAAGPKRSRTRRPALASTGRRPSPRGRL